MESDSKTNSFMRGFVARIAASIMTVLALCLAFWAAVAYARFARGGESALPLSDAVKLMSVSVLCLLIAMRWWMLRRR